MRTALSPLLTVAHSAVIRSFDVNKPGTEVEELQGGVAGGSILRVRSGLVIETVRGTKLI
jgi:translation initiation factor 2 gamma subunit (eIF-2gamma)